MAANQSCYKESIKASKSKNHGNNKAGSRISRRELQAKIASLEKRIDSTVNDSNDGVNRADEIPLINQISATFHICYAISN